MRRQIVLQSAGKVTPEKKIGEGFPEKCKLKCDQAFAQKMRVEIFSSYRARAKLSACLSWSRRVDSIRSSNRSKGARSPDAPAK